MFDRPDSSTFIKPVHFKVKAGFAVAIVFAAASGFGLITAALVNSANAPSQPIVIEACTPDDWADGVCDGPVDPDGTEDAGLVLTEDLAIPVAGHVCNTDPDASHVVTVEVVSVENGAAFPLIGPVEITWDQPVEDGCQADYDTAWNVGGLGIAAALNAEPGEDLGRWRIVGTAVPTDPDRYATYQWDSIKTFRLFAPEGT